MVGDKKIEDIFAELMEALAVGGNCQPIRASQTAAWDGLRITFDFDNAQTAPARYAQLGVIAEVGNIDSVCECNLKHVCARWCLDFLPVDCECDHAELLESLLEGDTAHVVSGAGIKA